MYVSIHYPLQCIIMYWWATWGHRFPSGLSQNFDVDSTSNPTLFRHRIKKHWNINVQHQNVFFRWALKYSYVFLTLFQHWNFDIESTSKLPAGFCPLIVTKSALRMWTTSPLSSFVLVQINITSFHSNNIVMTIDELYYPIMFYNYGTFKTKQKTNHTFAVGKHKAYSMFMVYTHEYQNHFVLKEHFMIHSFIRNLFTKYFWLFYWNLFICIVWEIHAN